MELKEAIKITKQKIELVDEYYSRGLINEEDKKRNEALKVLVKNLSLSGVVVPKGTLCDKCEKVKVIEQGILCGDCQFKNDYSYA